MTYLKADQTMTLYVYTCHTFTSGASRPVVEPLVKGQDGPRFESGPLQKKYKVFSHWWKTKGGRTIKRTNERTHKQTDKFSRSGPGGESSGRKKIFKKISIFFLST